MFPLTNTRTFPSSLPLRNRCVTTDSCLEFLFRHSMMMGCCARPSCEAGAFPCRCWGSRRVPDSAVSFRRCCCSSTRKVILGAVAAAYSRKCWSLLLAGMVDPVVPPRQERERDQSQQQNSNSSSQRHPAAAAAAPKCQTGVLDSVQPRRPAVRIRFTFDLAIAESRLRHVSIARAIQFLSSCVRTKTG